MSEDKTLVERWGVNWSGTDATHGRMPDGYWTPWHIANEAITTQAAEIARLRNILEQWLTTASEHLDTEVAGRTFEALLGGGDE